MDAAARRGDAATGELSPVRERPDGDAVAAAAGAHRRRRGGGRADWCRRSRTVRSACWSATRRARTRSPSARPTRRSHRCRSPSASARLRDPDVRARILAERPPGRPTPGTLAALFGPSMMRAALPARRSARLRAAAGAQRRGDRGARGPRPRTRSSTISCSATTARELLLFTLLNYDGGNLDPVYEMLCHPAHRARASATAARTAASSATRP